MSERIRVNAAGWADALASVIEPGGIVELVDDDGKVRMTAHVGPRVPVPYEDDYDRGIREERERVVAWLRKDAESTRLAFGCDEGVDLDRAADAIELGEHER